MFAWQATVQDEYGNAIPLPVVTVYQSDGVTLASIYDAAGGALANPFTGTAEGFVQFWVPGGQYKVVGASGSDVTNEWQIDLGGTDYPTRAALVQAVASGLSLADGITVTAAGLSYIAQAGATAIPDLPGLVPDGDVTPDHWVENTTPGTTDMASALLLAAAYSVDVHLFANTYRVSGGPHVLPTGRVFHGKGWTNGYGGGITRGSHILVDKVTAGDIFQITGASSSFADRARIAFHDIAFSTVSARILTDLTGITVNLFNLTNTFLCEWHNCLFGDLNVTKCITGTGSNNAVRVLGGQATSIGDGRAGFAPITGQFTYGNFVDFTLISDSELHDVVIELCGGIAVTLGNNCKAINCWNELAGTGYLITGRNAVVDGGSCRLHRRNGVLSAAAANGWTVPVAVADNNYANATGTANDTFAFRVGTTNTKFKIRNIDATSQALSAHPTKTEGQSLISLGDANSSGIIENIEIADPATGGNHFHDPSSALLTGNIRISGITRRSLVSGGDGFKIAVPGALGVVNGYVQCSGASAAFTGGPSTNHVGVIETRAPETLFRAVRNAIGPTVVSKTTPTSLVQRTGGAGSGAVIGTGLVYPAPYTHTGGGASEDNIIAELPSLALGEIIVTMGEGGGLQFTIAGRIKWDGATLTQDTLINQGSTVSGVALAATGGNLVVESTSSVPLSGATMQVRFTGAWIVA